MYSPILVPLDGSRLAEEAIPYGLTLARSMGARLTVFRVVQHQRDVTAAEEYLQPLARRLNADRKVVGYADAASGIIGELSQHPTGLAAMTTHGHTGLLEAILGGVALSVVRHARRPVLVYRPRGTEAGGQVDKEARIGTVVAPLDGSDFSERMLPHAVEMTMVLKADLTLVQVIPPEISEPSEVPPGDVLESSYVRGLAEEIKRRHGIEADWEVLHGHPADAICDYLNRRHDVMLAMSSHARGGLTETIFGSVTHECVRRAGVPVLVYRPES